MNNNYLEIENQLLLYKSKAQILQMYIELLKRTDKAIEILQDNSSYDDSDFEGMKFQNDLLEILRGKDEKK